MSVQQQGSTPEYEASKLLQKHDGVQADAENEAYDNTKKFKKGSDGEKAWWAVFNAISYGLESPKVERKWSGRGMNHGNLPLSKKYGGE